MELNLVLPWGCLSCQLLLKDVALEPLESYSSCCCSGNIGWWDGEMLYLVLYFYFLLVTYHYTFSCCFSTYSSYQPTTVTGYSSLYLLFMGWMIQNLLICANQQIVQSRCWGSHGGVRFRAPVTLVTGTDTCHHCQSNMQEIQNHCCQSWAVSEHVWVVTRASSWGSPSAALGTGGHICAWCAAGVGL